MTGCDLLDFGKPARQNGKRLPCERLMAENAKLRTLCADMVKMLVLAGWASVESDEEASQCIYRAEALGIEVV